MTQHQIDRAVARQTGESLNTIRHRGFSVVDSDDVKFDPEPASLRIFAPAEDSQEQIDWDEIQQFERPRRYHRRQALAAA